LSKKLENEVWNMERCAGCGACVTACSKRVLTFDRDADHPHKKVIMKRVGLTDTRLQTCHFCEMLGYKLCELSCPRLQEEWEEGQVQRKVLVRTTGKHKTGSPNEVIAYLLAAGMQAGMIDGVVMTDVDRWTLVPTPRVAESISEVMESSGNQYIWSPTLSGLKEAIYKRKLERVAVVGNPCMVQALSRLERSEQKALTYIADRVKLKVGLFCGGVYKQEALKDISSALKVPLHALKSITVDQKGDHLVAVTHDGKKKKMKLSQATNLIRPGCGRCYDLLSEESDISIGPIGAKKGHSVAIVRSPAGENILDNAVLLGLLETKDGVDEKALASAVDAKRKRKRAEMIDGLQVLMLEALKEPERLEEAKKRFGEIYFRRTRGGQAGGKEIGKGSTGCGPCHSC
jgi:coenzyme F420 hydrogenase subunit beta